jgi:hypothetical protein
MIKALLNLYFLSSQPRYYLKTTKKVNLFTKENIALLICDKYIERYKADEKNR